MRLVFIQAMLLCQQCHTNKSLHDRIVSKSFPNHKRETFLLLNLLFTKQSSAEDIHRKNKQTFSDNNINIYLSKHIFWLTLTTSHENYFLIAWCELRIQAEGGMKKLAPRWKGKERFKPEVKGH